MDVSANVGDKDWIEGTGGYTVRRKGSAEFLGLQVNATDPLVSANTFFSLLHQP